MSTMREGLRLFLRHFVAKKRPEMKEAVFKAEEAMLGSEGKLRL